MRSFQSFFLLIGIVLCNSESKAQTKEDDRIQQAISDYGANLKESAYKTMDAVLAKNPNAERALFVKANWEYNDKKYQSACDLLERLDKLNPNFNPLQNKNLAECYLQLGKIDQSRNQILEFSKISGLSQENKDYAQQMLRNLEFIKNAPKDFTNINFQNIGPQVNTTDNEYFPSTNADESMLYFTRRTKAGEDIYVSPKKAGDWSIAVPVDEPEMESNGGYSTVNSHENDGAHTIAPNGKYLFFTSCDRPKSYGSCDLYFSKMSGGIWGKPKILPNNINTKAWETQPCISADGKTIFFVSNATGGKGRGDIYTTQIKSDGTFTDPVNIGDVINTPGMEDKPFIHPDGKTLYFSSDGHPGFGQRDLFVSKLVDGKWTTPVNLGAGINSAASESAIFINALGTKGYLSRQNTENERSDYDIYTFDLPQQYRPDKVSYVKGIVVNAKTNQPMKASVKIQNLLKDDVISISSDEKNGDFLITMIEGNNYAFNVVKEGFAFYSQNFTINKMDEKKPNIVEIKLRPLETGTKFDLRNVFFETGKFDLRAESASELNLVVELLKKNPNIRIMINGHTDNMGQAASNQTLSEKRAGAVKQFIIDQGIDAERLQSAGYGSSKPISENNTEEGRSKNRRTEIEIL